MHLWQENSNQVFLKEPAKFYESSWDSLGASATIRLIAISYFSFLILYFIDEILAKRKQELLLDVYTNMQVLKMWILIITVYDWFQLFVGIGHLWVSTLLSHSSKKQSKCKKLLQDLVAVCSLEATTSQNTYFFLWL